MPKKLAATTWLLLVTIVSIWIGAYLAVDPVQAQTYCWFNYCGWSRTSCEFEENPFCDINDPDYGCVIEICFNQGYEACTNPCGEESWVTYTCDFYLSVCFWSSGTQCPCGPV